ncbi:MAG: VWA domain-containing protein [Pseudomonadales bacterium]|nr:VWA domain-containing protein [Pseudomonadales bacterium]
MINFETYWWFILTPLPWFIFHYLPANKKTHQALRAPFVGRLEAIQKQVPLTEKTLSLKWFILLLIWLLLLTTLNRPIIQGEPIKINSIARDMMLAVDISGSMDELDMQLEGETVRRIDSVKKVLNDFIDRRNGDRIGLILFADQAYVQAPLTFDLSTVKQLLNEAQLGFAGQKTAIGDALGLAIKRLIERPNQSRTLILLTDGANNAGKIKPLEASALAAENQIKIHTIAIGADFTIQNSWFSRQSRRPSSIDEKTLKIIAAETGGIFFRAKNTEQLETIYTELDRIEPVDQDAQFYRPAKQLFYIPLSLSLAIALLLVITELLLAALTSRQTAREVDPSS